MEIISVEEPVVAVRISQYPDDKKNEFLILGRSNVGKSSFINTIINRKNLARTSSKPGKTQTLNFYYVNKEFYIVDVPGYGYANVNKKQLEKFGLMIEEYLKNRPYLKHVFLLVDYNLPVTIVATKYDKVNRSLRMKQDDVIKKTLNPALGDEIINFSSVTKIGKERVYDIIESYFKK
jgi:GTP-binding protein